MNILETRVLGCPLRNAQVLARTALLRRALNWPDSITAVLLRVYENIITRDRVDQQLGSLSAYRKVNFFLLSIYTKERETYRNFDKYVI